MIFLRNHVISEVSALGGAFFPQFIPQGRNPPAAVYTVIDRTRQVTYSGTGELISSLVNIDVVSKRYDQAREIANEIRSSLVDFKGDMQGTHVEGCFVNADQDTSDMEPGFFRVTLTFNLWYLENGND